MTEDEALALLRALQALVQDAGLSSVAEQERATARAGNITEFGPGGGKTKPAATSQEPRSGEFRIEPIRPSQRLATLLDLLEAAVVGADLTEKAVLNTARALYERGEVGSIEVTFDEPFQDASSLMEETSAARSDTESTRRILGPQSSRDGRDQAIAAVANALEGLREVAGVPRADWLREVDEVVRRGGAWPGR